MKTKFEEQVIEAKFLLMWIAVSYSFCYPQPEIPFATPSGIVNPYLHSNYTINYEETDDFSPDLWEPIGPNGITAYSLAVDPSNPNIIFVGGASGLYKTIDGGKSWELVSEESLNKAIRAIAIHPSKTNVVLALFQSNYVPWVASLMRSDDGGKTWKKTWGKDGLDYSVGIIINPRNPQKMFFYSDLVYQSLDEGLTWKPTGTFKDVRALAIYRQNPEVLYGLDEKNLYKSSNGGNTWKVQGTQLPGFTRPEVALQVSLTDSNTLFLGNTSFDNTGGFYRSANGGVNWLKLITGLEQSKSINAIGIDPNNPNVLYAGGYANGLYRSTNAGGNWTLVSGSIPDRYIRALTIGSNGQVYCGFGGNLYQSPDRGVTWLSLNGNLQNISFFKIVPNLRNANILFASGMAGVYRSTDGGATWQAINNGLIDTDVFALAIDPINTNVLYAGTFQGLVYKTTDGGNNWIEKSMGLPVAGQNPISRISVHPENSSWIWTDRFGYGYQSKNAGESWSLLTANGQVVNELTFDPINPDILYARTIFNFLKTTNRGATWVAQETNLWWIFFRLTIDPFNSKIFYAESLAVGGVPSGTVIKSTDAGLTWKRADRSSAIRDIVINSNSPAFVYVATYGNGVRRSIDAGRSWKNYNSGLPHLGTFSISPAIDETHKLFVTTLGGSIYRVNETAILLADTTRLSSGFVLAQNYPNPFNPSTTIEFSLSRMSHVELKVFNLDGQEVATLLNQTLAAGRYKTTWDASGLPAGLYFCRLQAEGFTQTLKLTLLK